MRAIALLFVLLLACGDDTTPNADAGQDATRDQNLPDQNTVDEGTDMPLPTTPAERLAWPGPHTPGFRTFEVTYDRPDGAGNRTLPLAVWYPAQPPAMDAFPVRYTFVQSEITYANLRPMEGSFPVLVFSHGHQASPDASALLMEHFASHGWVVLAPRHVGNATGDPERTTSIYYLRPHDLRASLDYALEDDTLAPLLGTPRVVSGHSFGGYTAYAAAGASYDVDEIRTRCADGDDSPICTNLDEAALSLFAEGFADARYDAVVSMAAGDFELFGAGLEDITIPAFQVVAEGDSFAPGEAFMDRYWTTLNGPEDLRLNLLGGAHNSFTDICILLVGFPGCSDRDPLLELGFVKRFVLAFVQDRLQPNADAAAVLTEGDETVELTSR